jgi:hypothetical protein
VHPFRKDENRNGAAPHLPRREQEAIGLMSLAVSMFPAEMPAHSKSRSFAALRMTIMSVVGAAADIR